ncbi:MAG TPA: type 4a pilus biogenesis protein PilO [Gemmatimonadaceae bacterium]|nr:type 4a pilus biogenesis protein PilO [Gemmatimonadaceae bacterium]
MGLLPKTQRDQAMMLVTVVSLALVGVYYQYVWTPKGTAMATLSERIDTLETRNNRARREMSSGSMDSLRAQAEAAQKDLAIMRQLVPTSNEVPLLLEQVSTAARRAGLDLSGVEPQPVVEGEQFDTHKFKVSVIASYHQLAEFLTNVGSLTRIVASINLALAPTTNTTVQKRMRVDGALIDSKFEIQTYVAKTAAVVERGGKS